MKITIQYLVKEICKRENAKGKGYDLRANHVSACLKHLFDIFIELDGKQGQRKKKVGIAIWPASDSFKFYSDELIKRAKRRS